MSLFRSSLRVSPDAIPAPDIDEASSETTALAVLGGGCFWCTEAVYREVDGVLDVRSGYAGDDAAAANYNTVCSGRSRHAEVIQIHYDRSRCSFGQLLRIFFGVAHDPTQVDGQGNDLGPQYRSVIFAADQAQRDIAQRYIAQLDAAGVFTAPIATQIEALEAFFEAETYHQNYAARNPHQPYIAAVAAPKVDKLRRYFASRLRTSS